VAYGAQRLITFASGTDCPPALRKLARQYFDDEERIRPTAFSCFDKFLQEAARFGHEVRIYDDTAALIAEVRDAQARQTRLRERFGDRAKPWEGLLKVSLYPYQRTGALFAAEPDESSTPTRWGWARPFRPSPRRRSWLVSSAPNGP
jgi:hypothetical protein